MASQDIKSKTPDGGAVVKVSKRLECVGDALSSSPSCEGVLKWRTCPFNSRSQLLGHRPGHKTTHDVSTHDASDAP